MSETATQHRLGTHGVERRELPETVPELDADCCWHCNNPMSMMHTLECESCGYEVKGPTVQERPTCPECDGPMQCTRYIRRWSSSDDDRHTTVTKRRFHPETGEELPLEALKSEGFK